MDFIYMNEDAIEPLLKCPVCAKPYTDPILIPELDERLCRLCIYQSPTLINNPNINLYTSLTDRIVRLDEELLHDLLGNLPVQCVACEQKDILRIDFPEHRLHQCPKRIVLCQASDLKCPWSGTYEQFDEHIKSCTFESLRPILVESLSYRRQIEKYDQLFLRQQNEIDQLKNQIENSSDSSTKTEQEEMASPPNQSNEIEQLQNLLQKYDELFSNQQNEIEQLKNQNKQCEERLGILQGSFRVVLQDANSQRKSRDREFQDSISEQRNRDQDVQQLREQYQQLRELIDDLTLNLINHHEIDLFKQRLNLIEEDLKNLQKQDADQTSQLNILKKQEIYRKEQLQGLREVLDQQKLQILLLARKKSVIPKSYATIVDRIDEHIETYSNNSDIDLSNKHFENQDMELICKRTILDKQCQKLRLENNDINAKGATILADNLYGNTTLGELYLANNSISDMGAHAFAQVLAINNDKLTCLELHSNYITDEGVEYLSVMLKTNKSLVLLNLSSNRITDRGVHYLASSIAYYNATLQLLHLSSNEGITDESLEDLIDMMTNDNALRALGLKNCSLSTDAAEKLKEITKLKAKFLLEV